MNKNTYRITLLILGGIIICSFYLRNESVRETEVTYPLSHDAGDYFMYAYNLRHKHTYSREALNPDNAGSQVIPDAVRSPGYPLFLALFVDGLPQEKMLNKIVFSQMIISTLTILIAFFFFQSFLGNFWGAAAALLIALSPHLIAANSYLLTETLFCFLIVVVAWLISIFVPKPSACLAFLIGGSLGAASLVRPSLNYFSIVMVFFLIFHYGWKKGLRFFLIFFLGFTLICAPWIIRNIKTLNITTDKRLMINFLHHGMYPDFTFDEISESFGFPYLYDPRSEEISGSVGSVLKEITRRFRLEPLKHLKWFVLKKPLVFWSWNMVQGGDVFVYTVSKSPFFSNDMFKWVHCLMHALHRSLVFLGLLGSLMAWLPLSINKMPERSIYIARFASIFLMYYTIIHMLGAPFPRYAIPLRPFLYGMAMFPLYLVVFWLQRHRDIQK